MREIGTLPVAVGFKNPAARLRHVFSLMVLGTNTTGISPDFCGQKRREARSEGAPKALSLSGGTWFAFRSFRRVDGLTDREFVTQRLPDEFLSRTLCERILTRPPPRASIQVSMVWPSKAKRQDSDARRMSFSLGEP